MHLLQFEEGLPLMTWLDTNVPIRFPATLSQSLRNQDVKWEDRGSALFS